MKKLTEVFGEVLAYNQRGRDRWIAHVVKGVVRPGDLVLDVAAGTCPYKDLFVKCVYKTQDFVRLNSDQNRNRQAYGAIDYVCDVTEIPVPDQSFDIVLCTEALEHVPDPQAVIKEISRLLKFGGRVILTAPLGSGLHQEPFHFFGGFTPHWYRHVLSEHGFSDIVIEANGGSFKHFSQECLRFLRMTAPWRMAAPWWVRVLMIPVWPVLAPTLGIVLPLLCHWLDRYDTHQAFTVGYHVLATRK